MPRYTANKKAPKIVVIICGIGFFVSFGFGISFYYRDLPNKPQPELGRIYPLNNHGFLLYMTRQEELQQDWSFVVAGVLGVLAAIIDQFVDPFDRRKWEHSRNKRPPWNHRWGP
ncbi:MAG TPA: hypothetical protein VN810_02585 [Terriglobales bacterium]|nr:hypothetical protein [Terriglobales bacterium]